MPTTLSPLLDKDPASPGRDSLVGVFANLAVVAGAFLPWFSSQNVPEGGGGPVGYVSVWEGLSYLLTHRDDPQLHLPLWALVITLLFAAALVCPLGLHLWALVGRARRGGFLGAGQPGSCRRRGDRRQHESDREQAPSRAAVRHLETPTMGHVRVMAAIFGIFGLLYAAAGVYPLLKGRNYPGVLGRSFTQAGTRRMARAPARFWRGWGAYTVAMGLFWASFGLYQAVRSWPTLVVVAILLLAAATALVDLVRTAGQHGLLWWQSGRSAH